MQVEASVLFHLSPEKAPDVYRTVGPDYVKVILEPQFRSVTRGVTASYEARALYTSEQEALAGQIAVELRTRVEPRGIAVEATPLRKPALPPRLAAAIEEKLGAEQESQRMEFVLQKERQEADAGGSRLRASRTSSVSSARGSPRTFCAGRASRPRSSGRSPMQVVVVGSAKDGLPLILGGR